MNRRFFTSSAVTTLNTTSLAWRTALLFSLLAPLFHIFQTAALSQEAKPMESSKKQPATLQEATFAGGCFWCMEPPFDKTPGVIETIVGYTGGTVEDPSYEQITTGRTGHVEAVLIRFDPEKVSYEELLKVFWQNIDPTQSDGQFADRGSHYLTKIFFHSEEQRLKAERSKSELAQSGKFAQPIVTEIVPAKTFYRAEEYHQEYYKKNAVHYKLYRVGSGREQFIEKAWGRKEESKPTEGKKE